MAEAADDNVDTESEGDIIIVASKQPTKRQGTVDGFFGIAPKKAKGDENAEKKKPYDRNQSRAIRPEWFDKYTWLKHDKENVVFYCEICRKEGKKNAFTKGKSSSLPKKDDTSFR
jgi:hypothetical protein